MGGKSSSSSSSTTNTYTSNKSNSVGVGGDNNGIVLSGNEGDVRLDMTDYGAIDSAFEFGEAALSEAFGLGENAIGEMTRFGLDALSSIESSNANAMAFANSVNASHATNGASDMLSSTFMVYIAAGVGLALVLMIIMAVRK